MPREKIKFALRISPETQQLVKDLCPRDNCQSQNEAKHPPVVEWSDRYKAARSFLYGSNRQPQDHGQALALFQAEAFAGNALAMHDLGRMYAAGLGTEQDHREAAGRFGRQRTKCRF